jgi:hypothetical protein
MTAFVAFTLPSPTMVSAMVRYYRSAVETG